MLYTTHRAKIKGTYKHVNFVYHCPKKTHINAKTAKLESTSIQLIILLTLTLNTSVDCDHAFWYESVTVQKLKKMGKRERWEMTRNTDP